MQYSIGKLEGELDAQGMEFDRGSVYDRLRQLTDVRKAKGKRYRLETVLMIVVLAKLCGCDRPIEIAEWANNHREYLVKLMCLEREALPHYNTYRRILVYGVYREEIDGLVGEYNQGGLHGNVYALDGKAIRGMRKKDEESTEYLLSIYDVEQAKVMSQVEVGRKENEITKAPQALKMVALAQKWLRAMPCTPNAAWPPKLWERRATMCYR